MTMVENVRLPGPIATLLHAIDRRRIDKRRAENNRNVLLVMHPMIDDLYSMLYRVEDERGKEGILALIQSVSSVVVCIRDTDPKDKALLDFIEVLMPSAIRAVEAYATLEGRQTQDVAAMREALAAIDEVRRAVDHAGKIIVDGEDAIARRMVRVIHAGMSLRAIFGR